MKEKKLIINIGLVILVLILIAINIIFFINHNFKEDVASNNETNIVNTSTNINTEYNLVSEEQDEENRENKIATFNERQRMQTYFGQYISALESKDYESAYNMLYDGFKQNYFSTLQDFTTYAQNHYTSNMVVEYVNIEREGTIFVLTVKIRDPLNDNTQTEVPEQQIVVIENAVNDFKISFAVQQ